MYDNLMKEFFLKVGDVVLIKNEHNRKKYELFSKDRGIIDIVLLMIHIL